MRVDKLPAIVFFDFDRTIGYLYRDPSILTVLRDRVVELYNSDGAVPASVITELSDDGYHAWHRLHDWVLAALDEASANDLNARAERLVASFESERACATDLIPGAAEAIAIIATVVPVGIVSSNATSAVKAALNAAGIETLFKYVGGRETDPFSPKNLKPNPSQLELAISRNRVPPSECWYVGDDIVDVAAARAARMRSVGVTSGLHDQAQLTEAGADLVVRDLYELSEIVHSLK